MQHNNKILQIACASNDIDASRDVARALKGTLYCDERDEWQHLPFRALVTAATDDMDMLKTASDIGLYVVYRRLIKPGIPKVVALFPLVRQPEKTHREADTHWRDIHAPLALEHHRAMSHYTQLSVVQNLSGHSLDGFALCGFDSVEDLRERFFTHPDSQDVINADVRKFADLRNSPGRLIATEERFQP